MKRINRKDFFRLGGLAAIFTAVPASAAVKKNTSHKTDGKLYLADHCKGSGKYPRYDSANGEIFTLTEGGDPWFHEDACLGLKNMEGEFDAELKTGSYQTGEAIAIRTPASIRGLRSGFGNPNGEYPPIHGCSIRFEKHGLKAGREASLMNGGKDDRISLVVIEDLCLFRNPLNRENEQFGDGAAIWTDFPSDQLTINNVNVSFATYGLLNTSYIDAFRIRGFHTGRVTHPLYFASKEKAGKFTASWYGTVSDCCFADGDGPVVLKGNTQPWNFSNVNIVRQGRKETDFPPCNIYWGVSQGRFDAGVIDSPGTTFHMHDGKGRRLPSQIDADGMIIDGNQNTISTLFKDAHGKGKANLRLKSGSSRNIIRSQFGGCKEGAIDLIIEEGCKDNLVYVVPGMRILDQGENTRYIGKEFAEFIS